MNSSTFLAALVSAIVTLAGALFVGWRMMKQRAAAPTPAEQIEAERRASAARWAKDQASREEAQKEEAFLRAEGERLTKLETALVEKKLASDPVDRANERLKKLREKE